MSIQTGFSLVNAAVVCAILESISGLEPSLVITEPRYLKLVTVSSFCPFTLISVLMPLVPRELYRVFDYRQSRSRRRSDARARLCPTGVVPMYPRLCESGKGWVTVRIGIHRDGETYRNLQGISFASVNSVSLSLRLEGQWLEMGTEAQSSVQRPSSFTRRTTNPKCSSCQT